MEGSNRKHDNKQPMTDEERQQLAAKLDKDLDDFINSLPKKKYEDGWPEDRWEEEMAKHPFFMKEAPKPGAELHPLYEGLQKLKYDPEENEPDELATSYKEDGNFNFKHKNYRLAVLGYTEGIKVKCGNPDIESRLYNNRAAAHYFLENYRSSLKDCELALKLKPDYDKAIQRAAQCCYRLGRYDRAVEYCDKILDKHKENKDMIELRKKCVSASKAKERDDRKEKMGLKKKKIEEQLLLEEIRKRGVKIDGELALDRLEPHLPQLVHNRVSLDHDKNLIWPVVFLYPEYKIMDYIQGFHEKNTFQLQLEHVFETLPEWDTEKKYKPDKLNVYLETENKKLVKLDKSDTLEKVLKTDNFIIRSGTPSLIVLVQGSDAEKRFLEEYV